MGKQPTTGQKKTKDQISKAASQSKAAPKKWTKGKTKEKSEHAVFVDSETYDRLITGVPKMGRHISVGGVIEKYKVVGSIAKAVLRSLEKNGTLKNVEKHSRQFLYTPTTIPTEKIVVEKEVATKKGKKK